MHLFVRKILLDPFLLLLLSAMLIAAVLPARGEAADLLHWIVTAAIALLFFLYGAKLSPAAVASGLLHWRLQSLVLVCTYGIFPVLGLVASHLLRGHLPDDLVLGILFLCLLPSTVQSSIAFTSIARGNVAAAITSASLSNLAGVFVTPLLVGLVIGTHGGDGFDLSSVGDIALQILLPFAIGQLCRPLVSAFLQRHARLTQFTDRGAILLVVYSAFSEGMVAGIWSHVDGTDLLWILATACVLLALILAITALLGKLFGFSREDQITILFCGSKKSLATGVPMAGILFAGQSVSLVVLPLMIFHQIQLFVCALLAERFASQPETASTAVQTSERRV
ncbi:bile acid:sodium symporter [Tianweitania sp. BSSL-BM11]|uniref:Bile acid:sodium symporter n=1 Tax=Tianweitania aestuarii TaxID=2814886 RepID=A0ABS5S226_9HYPH|nr:bile acid:sodium symporter family protein [Tianweitania aestuarii]MBS9722549.1 bile acid:sodium symporter [Tianweitania aestuarii]